MIFGNSYKPAYMTKSDAVNFKTLC